MLSIIRKLFRHLQWADERSLRALRTAGPDHARAQELLAHVLGAEHTWLTRIRQVPAQVAVWPSLTLEACTALAAENHAGFSSLIEGLAPADLGKELPYTNSAGQAFRSTVEDMLLQVALHGCYHRGQVAQLLRQADAAPEATDYIAFVRGAPAATRRAL